MEPNETADIRRALDRLQQAFELLNDRYRDLRRERKQLRERIEEVMREREIAETAGAAQSEMAANDRRRAVEMEERALQAESRAAEALARIDELERVVAEREALVAEQEDTLQRLRADLAQGRQTSDETWRAGELLREENEGLRRQLAQTQTDLEGYRSELERMRVVGEGEVTISGTDLDRLRSENASLRQMVALQQQERSDLEGKHHQAIGKLDAATRAEAMARTEVASLEEERITLERQVNDLRDAYSRLESSIASDDSGRIAAEAHAAQLLAHERELRDLHERLERRDREHAVERAAIEERVTAAELERERLERQVRELQSERDSARTIADRMREQLSQADASDDERLRAQRVQIDNLMSDLSEALDMAARKEHELAAAAADLERAHNLMAALTEKEQKLAEKEEKLAEMAAELDRMQSRVAALTEEVEYLRTAKPEDEPANGAVSVLTDDDRRELGEQIDRAIRLIDRHLEKGV